MKKNSLGIAFLLFGAVVALGAISQNMLFAVIAWISGLIGLLLAISAYCSKADGGPGNDGKVDDADNEEEKLTIR